MTHDDQLITKKPYGSIADKEFEQLIEKTRIEMKRLGWSLEEFRYLLEKQFGKRSIWWLSHHELEYFFQELKQSNPNEYPLVH